MLHAPLENGTDEADDRRDDPIVYVIDDEAELRESSCFLLGALGLNCVNFADGRAFLDEVERLRPGCVLLDVVMRGMGGLEVQAEMIRRGVDWPVIFMSGHQNVPTVVEAVKWGAVEFLEKPFTDEQLLAALHRGFVALRERQAGR